MSEHENEHLEESAIEHANETRDSAVSGDLVRARRAARIVGLVIPLLVIAAVTALAVAWMPRMPDPAATHWGFSGGPDGFGSPWVYVWLPAVLGGGLTLMMWAFVEFGSRGGGTPLWSSFHRFMVAFTAGFSVFICVVFLSTMAVQLDLGSAEDAGGIGGFMGLAFGSWAVATVIAWFVQPRIDIPSLRADPSEPLELSRDERAVWIGQVRPSAPLILALGFTVAALLAVTVAMFVMTVDPIVRWVTLGLLVLMAGLAVTTLWFSVRIDASGIVVRSAAGWPTFRLAASEVADVQATRIVPFAEFGGWGLRWGPGRFGVVMRTGDGIVVTRHDGRVFAITVDDAQSGAALLAGAAARVGAEAGRYEDEAR